MSADPDPESAAQKGTKVHFAPVTAAVQDEVGLEENDSARYGYEYNYPDLEQLCSLTESMGDDDYAQLTGKLGPAAAAAQRAASNAAAAATIVGGDRKVGKAQRRPPPGKPTVSAAPSSGVSGVSGP